MDELGHVTEERRYGTTADQFKPLAEIVMPDPRQRLRARFQLDGAVRSVGLEDLHRRMGELTLGSSVPRDVQTGFDLARNLFVYSWFVYRFQMMAEFQAYASLELALGKRIEIERAGNIRHLSNRLNFAVAHGWLRAIGVRRYQQSAERRKRYAEDQRLLREYLESEGVVLNEDGRSEAEFAIEYLGNLRRGLPLLRNSLAHGEPMLHGGAAITVEICCDLINQLFPQPAGT